MYMKKSKEFWVGFRDFRDFSIEGLLEMFISSCVVCT